VCQDLVVGGVRGEAQAVQFSIGLVPSAISSQENELKRLAGELHDGLGQQLLNIRTCSRNEIEHVGVREALETMLERMAEASGVKFTADLDPVDDVLPANGGINLYRIVQEATNTIVKHACQRSARHAQTRAAVDPADGDRQRPWASRGRDRSNGAGGFGLRSLAARTVCSAAPSASSRGPDTARPSSLTSPCGSATENPRTTPAMRNLRCPTRIANQPMKSTIRRPQPGLPRRRLCAGVWESAMSEIRAVIADDLPVFRHRRQQVVDAEADMRVLATPGDRVATLDAIRGTAPMWPCSMCACRGWADSKWLNGLSTITCVHG
jgi:hypothetical protein